MILPLKDRESRPSQEELPSSRMQAASPEKVNPENFRSPVLELQLRQQESKAYRDSQDPSLSQKPASGTKNSLRKSIMEEILVEESPDLESFRSYSEPSGFSLPEWNLCLGDLRKVLLELRGGWGTAGRMLRASKECSSGTMGRD